MKNILYILLILIIFSTFACKNITEDMIIQKDDLTLVKEKLSCIGLNTNKVSILSDNVIKVDDDILIDKDLLMNGRKLIGDDSNNIQTRQYVVNPVGIVDWVNVQNIKVWIDPVVSQSWATAARVALSEWSNINGSVVKLQEVTQFPIPSSAPYLVITSNNTTVNGLIPYNCILESLSSPYSYALAYFPQSGTSGVQNGNRILINADAISISNEAKRTIMRHEIGHTLGLRHNEALANEIPLQYSCDGSSIDGINLICNTPANDLYSIMRPGSDGFTEYTFTNNDISTIQKLYPAPTTVSGFSTYLNNFKKNVFINLNHHCNRLTIFRNGVVKFDGCGSGQINFADIDNFPLNYVAVCKNFKEDKIETINFTVY